MDEIQLFGLPVSITIPGNGLYKWNHNQKITISGGAAYDGYLMNNTDDAGWYDIYIGIGNLFYRASEFGSLRYSDKPLPKFVTLKQPLATFSDLKRQLLFLYRRTEDLQNQLYDKIDKY